jgi:nitrogen fixation protein NifU and related proteins
VTAELQDLYQELILDHYKHPRNRRALAVTDHEAKGHNPLCGDRINVYLKLDGDRVSDMAFEGNGCAISTASASLMTEAVKGKTIAEAREIFEKFHALVTGRLEDAEAGPDLGKLEVFGGVSQYPMRVKCATLAWHTFEAALQKSGGTISTE